MIKATLSGRPGDAPQSAASGLFAAVSARTQRALGLDEKQHPVAGSVTCGSELLVAQEASAGDPPLLLHKSGSAAQLFSGA